jgi:hypothetical protein
MADEQFEPWRDRLLAATTIDELHAVEKDAVDKSFSIDVGAKLHDVYSSQLYLLKHGKPFVPGEPAASE